MPDNSNYQFRAVPLDLLSYVTKKQKSGKYYFRYLLDRTMMMFEYKGLPDSIDPHVLERYLQVNGVACITKAPDGKLYCFNGSWGGPQDVYYRPTKFIISNPHVSQLADGTGKQFTKECTIFGTTEHDGVLMRNDTEWASLTPLIARYAVLMTENCITVRSATIMLRCLALLSAPSDKGYKSALAYLAKLEAGELGVIGDSAFSDGVKLQSPPSNNGSYLTQFIELQQYLKGSFFNELGLRANYNMKREAIGQGESTLDADSILPLCDNMLKCRREDIMEVNNLFGTEITVDFSSAWLENHLESSINIISQLNESGALDDGTVSEEVSNDPKSNEAAGATGATEDSFGSNVTPLQNLGNDGAKGENSDDDKSNEGTNGPVSGSSNGAQQGSGETGEAAETDDKEVRGDGEDSTSGETDSEDGNSGDGGADSEEINKVKEELESNDLTFVEGAVEVVNQKISQLIADARKGDLDD